MKTQSATHRFSWRLLLCAGLLVAPAGWTQVPVDENGNPIQPVDEAAAVTGDAAASEQLMTPAELEALVGPIALYPDDLLAIVLPASTYPLEIVQAARFLEDHEENDSLEPDESWDDSIVALLNYPEVLEMMNDDIDWTWRLGAAVASQQPDVIAAVEAFRDRAYAAGNLKSDQYQTVTENDDGVIEIEPVSEEIIYVPYYEPERVVVYQPRPAYYYYPRPYPVYYYPYPYGYNFYANYFWGVTTAFTIGWTTNNLHVFHHSYWGHPYYGRTYYPHWYYRRPSITIYNTWYGEHRSERTRDHYARGDVWRPRHTGGARPGFHRSRADYYRVRSERSSEGYRDRAIANGGEPTQLVQSDAGRGAGNNRPAFRGDDGARPSVRNGASSEDRAIRFRERESRPLTTSAGHERTAAGVDRRATVTTRRQADERRPAVSTERAQQPTQRAVPRSVAPNATAGRSTVDPARVQQDAVRRAQATRSTPVTRAPTVRGDTQRQTVAPRASVPARASAPRPSASTARSVSRPAASAPRSAPRPAASAARSVSRPSSSAPRVSAPTPAPRPSSSSVRRPAPSSGDRPRVRDR